MIDPPSGVLLYQHIHDNVYNLPCANVFYFCVEEETIITIVYIIPAYLI